MPTYEGRANDVRRAVLGHPGIVTYRPPGSHLSAAVRARLGVDKRVPGPPNCPGVEASSPLGWVDTPFSRIASVSVYVVHVAGGQTPDEQTARCALRSHSQQSANRD